MQLFEAVSPSRRKQDMFRVDTRVEIESKILKKVSMVQRFKGVGLSKYHIKFKSSISIDS